MNINAQFVYYTHGVMMSGKCESHSYNILFLFINKIDRTTRVWNIYKILGPYLWVRLCSNITTIYVPAINE